MITYRKLTEINDNEGETWHFFIPVPGNEAALDSLAKMLDVRDLEDAYRLSKDMFTEVEVDTLVKYADNTGYMTEHNKLAGILDIKKLEIALDSNDVYEALYKGGIRDFLK